MCWGVRRMQDKYEYIHLNKRKQSKSEQIGVF